MRGIVRFAGYLPYRRLDTSQIRAFLGSGGGKGTRTVAGHDEDTTTMGVEALRAALRGAPEELRDSIGTLTFSTTSPAYLDKTNAAVLHGAAGLTGSCRAWDFGGSLRSGTGALVGALEGSGTVAVVLSDTRDGLPGSADESWGGDGAACFVVADATPKTPVLAELVASASTTEEFLDRWRQPGEWRSRTWEERFGEIRYVDIAVETFNAALERAGLEPGQVATTVVTGMHARAVGSAARKLGASGDSLVPVTGQAGLAHPGLVLTHLLENASPQDIIVLIHLADGADALVVRATDAIAHWVPVRPLATQLSLGAPVSYARFLAWRQMITPEPPRRPEPGRVSTPAAWRSGPWKLRLTGSRDPSSGAVHLPPSRVSMTSGELDTMEPLQMSEHHGTVATFTVDRLAYSPSPPIVFAVVDFDGGGRFPVEMTDCDESEVAIGTRVEMTFRRLFSADGIHDYFFKARPLREEKEQLGGASPSETTRAGEAAASRSADENASGAGQ
jgi:hydroxymethylglutaryl-CoA synthase